MNHFDVVKGEWKCPRCGGTLMEKRPKSKFVLKKATTVRLFCMCGYIRDEQVSPEDFYKRDPE